MTNSKVSVEKVEEVKKEKEISGYRLMIMSFIPHLSGKKIYIHANGETFEFDDGDEVDVPVLVKEMLDENVRVVKDPKTKKMVHEREYKYSIVKTYYK